MRRRGREDADNVGVSSMMLSYIGKQQIPRLADRRPSAVFVTPTLRVRPHHDVAIIDDSGLLVVEKRIPDNPAGLSQQIVW